MATVEEVLAKAAEWEAAGQPEKAAKLRAHAETLKPKYDAATVEAKAAEWEAKGDAVKAAKLRSYAATLPTVPAGSSAPNLNDMLGITGRRADDPNAASLPAPARVDNFGETAGAMIEGPMAAAGAFAGGLVGGESPSRDFLANDPLTRNLPGPVLTGLGGIGDLGGAVLSGAGAGLSGLIGLGTELVPGQSAQDEKKLAEDLTGMAMFAVPELAGASSLIGKAASTTGKISVPQIGTKQWRNAFGASEAKPTIESLRAAKNVAYEAVDEAGETFDVPAMTALRDRVKADLEAGNYVSGVDKQTDAVVSLLDRKAGTEMSLGQLDKLRQEFYKRLAAAPNEVGIRDAIDAIDEMIAGRADTSDLMTAARLSNSRYKKAELLDLAFQKAKDQTAATGSGGNILNKMRQAVVSIIDNPKNAKWFDKDEIATMRSFVEGGTGQNALRLAGKISPNGNGLMLALNLGAAGGTGGASLLLTGAAVGAKALADRAAIRGGDALIGKMAGGGKKAAPAPKTPATVAAPVPAVPLAGQEAYEPLWQRYGR